MDARHPHSITPSLGSQLNSFNGSSYSIRTRIHSMLILLDSHVDFALITS
jgi:hypothetical protein